MAAAAGIPNLCHAPGCGRRAFRGRNTCSRHVWSRELCPGCGRLTDTKEMIGNRCAWCVEAARKP